MNRDKGQKIRLTVVVILLSVISLFPVQIIANQADKEPKPAWPLFQHDARHTGRSTYKGPDNPQVKWVFNGRFSTSRSYPLIGVEETIYIAEGGELVALTPTGVIIWRFNLGVDTPPGIGLDGTIYFGSDGYLYAVSPQGIQKWKKKVVKEKYGRLRAAPVVASDGTIYISSSETLYAINPQGGKKWSFKGVEGKRSFPAIDPAGNIYIGGELDSGASLLAISANGKLKWQYKLDEYGTEVGSPSIAKDGTIYISADSKLYAFNPNGTTKWVVEEDRIPSAKEGAIPSIGPKGTIFHAGCAFTPNGTIKQSWFGGCSWKFRRTHSYLEPQPLLVDSEGVIYIGVLQGEKSYIYAINPGGTVKWRLPTAEVDPLAIASDGTIYAVGRDNLYAIGEPSP